MCIHNQQWCTGRVDYGPYLPDDLSDGQMVTLNNQIYYFGGKDRNGITSGSVFRLKHVTDQWERITIMSKARKDHLVLSVPEEWLCHGRYTLSSTTEVTSTDDLATTITSTSVTTGKIILIFCIVTNVSEQRPCVQLRDPVQQWI